jgi:Icc-related predicted phosphoesterase
MVKILCVSDTVMQQMENAAHLRRRYHDIDLLLSCGDMPAAYLEFITSVLNIPLFYVRGNHDEAYADRPPGGEDLHNRIITYKGLSFCGLEGSIRYNQGVIQYTDGEMMRMVLGFAPRMQLRKMRHGHGVDIFVTHSPAYRIHDGEDRPHTGFKAFLRFLDWYRPRYMLHGHVHTYDRRVTTETDYNATHIMNINPYVTLEVEPLE